MSAGDDDQETFDVGRGLAAGLAIGVGVGVALGNPAVGIGVGLVFGWAGGLLRRSTADKSDKSDNDQDP